MPILKSQLKTRIFLDEKKRYSRIWSVVITRMIVARESPHKEKKRDAEGAKTL